LPMAQKSHNLEGGTNSCELRLFKRVNLSKGKKSLAMVCSCNEKVGNKKPGHDGAGGAAQKKRKT
jgi:hypothetical protein